MGLLITYQVEEKSKKYSQKHKLDDFLNNKSFKVSDIPLSYRQVNVLSAAKLLGANSQKQGEWRKFSFKELVYISILVELKNFGFDHKQLRNLHDSFFKEPDIKNEYALFTKKVAETAIACTFVGVEISVLAFSDGKVYLYDPTNFLQVGVDESSYIRITLNDIVNDILKKIGKEPIYPELTIEKLCSTIFDTAQTSKEKQVIDLLRSNKYSAIRIRKKDGKINVIHAETDNQGRESPSSEDLIKTLNENDFQDIRITKRDGNIVNYRVEQAFKF